MEPAWELSLPLSHTHTHTHTHTHLHASFLFLHPSLLSLALLTPPLHFLNFLLNGFLPHQFATHFVLLVLLVLALLFVTCISVVKSVHTNIAVVKSENTQI
jgi:hypothetical protein